MEISPNSVESRQLEEGCDGDWTRVLLQFPKQRGVRRFCFMYSTYGGHAANDLLVRFGRLCQKVRCGRSPGRDSPLLRTRKASHVFEPPDEGSNLADNRITLAQAQIRPEPIVLVRVGHCSITNLSDRSIVWRRSQCDGTARFPGGHEV